MENIWRLAIGYHLVLERPMKGKTNNHDDDRQDGGDDDRGGENAYTLMQGHCNI